MHSELEQALSSPEQAYRYALNVLQGRFPEGEPVIAQDSRWAYYYARDVIDVINDRWPEGEAVIAKDAEYAYMYARWVIEGRFIEGEAAIRKVPYWRTNYRENVLDIRYDI